MMRLLRDLGFPESIRFEDGIAEIDVDLTRRSESDIRAGAESDSGVSDPGRR